MRPTRTTTTRGLADALLDERRADAELQQALRLFERASVRARRVRAAVCEARALHEQALFPEPVDVVAPA